MMNLNLRSICKRSVVLLACAFAFSQASFAETAEPIKIGALLPFSGGCELYGEQAKLGVELAVREINAGGGILGRPLQVIYEDTKTRPDPAKAAARKLVEKDGVLTIIGPFTSQNLEAVTPVLEELKTPLLYGTNYEGRKPSRYMFGLSTVPNQELSELIPYMSKSFGKSFYLLGADRIWPHKMFDAAEPFIAKAGAKVVKKEYTLGNEDDFTPLIKRILTSKAKVLVFAMKGDGLEKLIAQASENNMFKKVKLAYIGLSETDLAIFHGKGENMYVAVPFVATSKDPKIKDFVAKVKAMGGGDTVVSNFVFTHYNAVRAIKTALEKAGKVDKEALIDTLEGLEVESPTGPITIGKKHHHTTMNMFIARTAGDQLNVVKQLGQVAPELGEQ
jgi:urea transport system substrate-binding protein